MVAADLYGRLAILITAVRLVDLKDGWTMIPCSYVRIANAVLAKYRLNVEERRPGKSLAYSRLVILVERGNCWTEGVGSEAVRPIHHHGAGVKGEIERVRLIIR
jgi:hypothetical protein